MPARLAGAAPPDRNILVPGPRRAPPLSQLCEAYAPSPPLDRRIPSVTLLQALVGRSAARPHLVNDAVPLLSLRFVFL